MTPTFRKMAIEVQYYYYYYHYSWCELYYYVDFYLTYTDEADENGINPVQTTDPSTDENFISDETIARLRKVRVKQIPRVADNANYNLRHTQRRDENYTALTAAIFYKDLNARVINKPLLHIYHFKF